MLKTVDNTFDVDEDRPGYKKTKLGWVPKEWMIMTGNSITELITKGSSPKWQGFEYSKEGVLFITSENVREGILDLKKKKYLPVAFSLKQKSASLLKGDVLINIVGASIGRACLYNISLKANINQAVSLFRTNKHVENEFISQFLNFDNTIKRLLGIQSDGARPNLSLQDLKLFKFLVPGIPEQRAIVNCLKTWDNAINRQKQLTTAKEQLKKALMQQLLTGKKRLNGFDEEWENLKFSDIAERVKRKNEEANDTVVTISAQRGFVLQEDFFNKRVASDTLLNYTLVHKGEFCYNKSYSKGYPMGAFKRLDDFEKAVVTTLYICFSLRENVDSDFMIHYFEAGRMIPNLMRIAQEGGRAHGLLNISLPDFFSLQVSVPLLEEQTEIARVLNAADQEIKILNKQLEKLKEQKKGLMQQLLTGKKRLKF